MKIRRKRGIHTKSQRRQQLAIQTLELRLTMASDWQNPLFRFDVDDDATLSPLDALMLISKINSGDTTDFSKPVGPNPYYDVDGDKILSPLDVLEIINQINLAHTDVGITATLRSDSGASPSDHITNIAVISGAINGDGTTNFTARARYDRGQAFAVTLGANNRFEFSPPQGEMINGTRHATLVVSSPDGRISARRVSFTLDTVAPTPSSFGLLASDDTGLLSNDGITRLNNPRVILSSETGTQVNLGINSSTIFTGVSNGVIEQRTSNLADGTYELIATLTDVAGNTGVYRRNVVVDTVPPISPIIDLAPSSDSGIVADRVTNSARVTLQGQSEPNTFVSVVNRTESTRSAGDGSFSLFGIPLVLGGNLFQFESADFAGNTSTSNLSITRINETTASDPVLAWNNALLSAIQRDATPPPIATRIMAITSIAMLDTLNAIEKTPSYMVSLPAPSIVSIHSAITAAADTILRYHYPAQTSLFDSVRQSLLNGIPEGLAKTNGLLFGKNVADAVTALRDRDGWDGFVDYLPRNSTGTWQQTAPMFEIGVLPHWGNVTPFGIENPLDFVPNGPPSLTSTEYADAYNQVKSLGARNSTTRTPEQTQIARFWSDGSGTYTPPGHWNKIANEVALSSSLSIGENARLFAMLNIALSDASIVSWKTKYENEFWRPITAIQQGNSDDNPQTARDSNWAPLLITPAHPEYTSGHSTYSGAAARILAKYFGDNTSFSTTSLGLAGVTRSFSSFSQAASEAGFSRILGGIHFEFSNQDGRSSGQAVADAVWNRFNVADDVIPPSVIFQTPEDNGTFSSLPEIRGWVLDNLSGVARASIQLNDNPATTLTLDNQGRFIFRPSLLTDGTADGSHTVRVIANDMAGLTSDVFTFRFTLDTRVPTIQLSSPVAGTTVSVGQRIEGTVSGTGSPIVSLGYRIGSGPMIPMSVELSSGSFSHSLDLSRLSAGSHSLQITAKDAAGLETTLNRSIVLAQPIPLAITGHTPLAGASDISSTFRPQVNFSRPVNKATLTSASFYATDTTGSKLPATIVPSADGSFAWLFLANPMPSSSTIAVTVNGDLIRAMDGSQLDADNNGAPGGSLRYSFSTVSLSSLPNTSIKGRVVDPGNDLRMMTIDDILAGADGALHTADDVFLNPIAGAKIFILGREAQPVFTDANGFFELNNVPAGTIKLAVDGRTATNAPNGIFWPEMVMDLELDAGYVNTVMGSMGSREERAANIDRTEVYLPRLQTSILKPISSTETTTVTVDPAASPNLTSEQRANLKLEVVPGSIIGENGQPVTNPRIGISTVPPELVRDMLPPGLLQHTFDLTIQSPDAATFNTPLKMTFPNVFNATPGTKLNFLSFDHTTGRLVIEGTATVSADGQSVTTDTGTGITKPGWHGLVPPGVGIGVRMPVIKPLDPFDPPAEPPTPPAPPPPDPEFEYEKVEILFEGFIPPPAVGLTPWAYGGDNRSFEYSPQKDGRYRFHQRLTVDLNPHAENPIIGNIERDWGTSTRYLYNDTSSTPNRPWWWRDLNEDAVVVEAAKLAVTSDNNFVSVSKRDGTVAVKMKISGGNPAAACLPNLNCAPNLDAILDLRLYQPKYGEPFFWMHGETDGFPAYELYLSGKLVYSSTPIVTSPNFGPLALLPPMEVPINTLNWKAIDGEDNSSFASNSSSTLRASDLFYSVAEYETGRIVSQGRNRDAYAIPGSLLLNANTVYNLEVASPVENLIGSTVLVTGSAGTTIDVPPISMFIASRFDDDNDGIRNSIELVVGTSSTNADSNGDGITDFAAIQQGLDPLAGRPVVTGIVANLPLQGEAKQVVVTGDVDNVEDQIAYVATGSYGLAIVDVSQFNKPTLLGQIDLPGEAVDVAVDTSSRLAAVATGSNLSIVDISDSQKPVVKTSIRVNANQVEINEGIVYAAVGGGLRSYAIRSGSLIQDLSLGFVNITGLVREGSILFSMDANGTLRAIDISGPTMTAKGSFEMPQGGGGGGIFVGNGIAYVPAIRSIVGGYATVDVRNPDNLSLIANSAASQTSASTNPYIVTNDSGLGVMAVGGGQGVPPSISVYDVRDPAKTDEFVTLFPLLSEPSSVTIAGGIAFVANGSGGLQIVNYRAFDNRGVAPTITISVDASSIDIAPNQDGVQVLEGFTVPINSQVVDDVQARSVELLVNSNVVSRSLSFPFNLAAVAPILPDGVTSSDFTVQARATDTGGNSTLSNVIRIQVRPDTTAPTISQFNVAMQDFDTTKPGVQIREGTSLVARFAANDLGGVNRVELLQNGQVLQTQMSRFGVFGFESPVLENGESSRPVTLQIRVWDVAGNATISSEVRYELVPDTILPRIVKMNVRNDDIKSVGAYWLNIEFDKEINPSTLTNNSFKLLNSIGQAIDAERILIPTPRSVQVQYTLPIADSYNLTVEATLIQDRSGNRLGEVPLVYRFKATTNDIVFPRTQIAAGLAPQSVIPVDLNSDGKLDLVTSNVDTNNVLVFIGNGDGTYASPTPYSIGNSSGAIAIDDLNGDGRFDLVMTHFNANNLSVLYGNGDGTFGSATSYDLSNQPSDVVIGDFNDDGLPDLAVAIYAPHGNVAILLGRADGVFIAAGEFALGSYPASISSADLDNDGQPDLVVTYLSSNFATVLVGNGDGTFTDAGSYAGGRTPLGVAIKDLNGDGWLDLVTTNVRFRDLSVLLNAGDGTFLASTIYEVGTSPHSVEIEDIDGDGRLDLIASNYDSNDISILFGDGDGTFGSSQTIAVGRGPRGLGIVDLNEDGRLDILVANSEVANVSVLLNVRNGQALRASSESFALNANTTALDPLNATPPIESARMNWVSLGVAAGQLSGVTFVIANLPGTLLGYAMGRTIYLDDDASGWGWFIDLTPDKHEEFDLRDSEWSAITDESSSGIDLLTVIMHEFGHVLGLDDLFDDDLDLMNHTLGTGIRRLPRPEHVDQIFGIKAS